MAKLKCFLINGLDLWFWPNDHDPPHFHAKRKGEWELRVKFQESRENMLEIKWRRTKKTSISTRDRKSLAEMVEKHRLEILKEWEQKVNQS
jgi:hypothetical protein